MSFSLEEFLEIFATCNFKNYLLLENIIKFGRFVNLKVDGGGM